MFFRLSLRKKRWLEKQGTALDIFLKVVYNIVEE